MTPLAAIAALAAIVLLAIAIACGEAWLRAKRGRDWREDWCTFDCWAEDGQQGPCKDCSGRRAAWR